ncbi:hypothetical protein [Ideonella sp.]|uniref:hypothetical protein n=1 Tax=Ideonella sp. TaxID=1929293 RepID=UPI0035B261B1
MQHTIIGAQRLVYPFCHSAFTHVAMYAGKDHVFDAALKPGVSHRLFTSASGASFIRVRRLVGLTALEQFDLCDYADQLCGPYGLGGAIMAGVRASFAGQISTSWRCVFRKLFPVGAKPPTAPSPDQALYCGEYVDLVYRQITAVSVVDGRMNFAPLPAAFSESQEFEDVRVHW